MVVFFHYFFTQSTIVGFCQWTNWQCTNHPISREKGRDSCTMASSQSMLSEGLRKRKREGFDGWMVWRWVQWGISSTVANVSPSTHSSWFFQFLCHFEVIRKGLTFFSKIDISESPASKQDGQHISDIGILLWGNDARLPQWICIFFLSHCTVDCIIILFFVKSFSQLHIELIEQIRKISQKRENSCPGQRP